MNTALLVIGYVLGSWALMVLVAKWLKHGLDDDGPHPVALESWYRAQEEMRERVK